MLINSYIDIGIGIVVVIVRIITTYLKPFFNFHAFTLILED